MARRPLPSDPAGAAAAFADGHIDPVAPVSVAAPLAAADPLEAIRQAEHVALTEDVLDHAADAREGFLLLVCSGKPGFRRGGIAHPARAEYPLDAFTQEQLDAFGHEPCLELVAVGGQPIARATRLFGAEPLPALPLDPRLAGRAAADAISRAPNRSEPGLRNAVSGRVPTGFSVR